MEVKLGFGKKENDALETATWEVGHILYLLYVYVWQLRSRMITSPVVTSIQEWVYNITAVLAKRCTLQSKEAVGIMKRRKGQVERGLGIEETSDFNLANVSK